MRKGCFYLLPGITITAGDQTREKISVRQNSIIAKKQWKWTKCSLVPLKPQGFFRCYDYGMTLSSTQFFHTHIKDWQVKISLYISLYTYKFLKFVKDNWQNVLKCVWKGIHIYKICMQFYEKINSLTKVWRI